MTEEEYNKLSTFEKIDYDINIELYMKYNDQIASINDHLGDIYGYSDLKDVEDLEKQEELMLYKKALKEKCDVIDKALCSIASCDWNDKYVIETYDILKGSEE